MERFEITQTPDIPDSEMAEHISDMVDKGYSIREIKKVKCKVWVFEKDK